MSRYGYPEPEEDTSSYERQQVYSSHTYSYVILSNIFLVYIYKILTIKEYRPQAKMETLTPTHPHPMMMVLILLLLKKITLTQTLTIPSHLTQNTIQVQILVSILSLPTNIDHFLNLKLVTYGGMVNHEDNEEDFYLHVDPTVNQEKLSDFEISNCRHKPKFKIQLY